MRDLQWSCGYRWNDNVHRHSEKRHPVLAEAVKEKVSPGLAEDGVEQSPGLDDGVQV